MLFLLCNHSMKFNHSFRAMLPGLNVAKLPGEGAGLHSKQCLLGTHRAPATLSDLENLLPSWLECYYSSLFQSNACSSEQKFLPNGVTHVFYCESTGVLTNIISPTLRDCLIQVYFGYGAGTRCYTCGS